MDITSVSSGLSSLLSDTGTTADKRLTLSINRADTDDNTSLAGSLTVSNDDAASFAASLMDKITAATASNAGDSLSAAGVDLEKSLTDAVEYVRDNFGDAAAKTVMGLISKGVGDGAGGEDAMGKGLLSALQFIDNQFGVAAGDQAINYFNGALNNAVNAYYQNGHNEEFYASDGTLGASQLQDSLSASLSSVAQQYGQDAGRHGVRHHRHEPVPDRPDPGRPLHGPGRGLGLPQRKFRVREPVPAYRPALRFGARLGAQHDGLAGRQRPLLLAAGLPTGKLLQIVS